MARKPRIRRKRRPSPEEEQRAIFTQMVIDATAQVVADAIRSTPYEPPFQVRVSMEPCQETIEQMNMSELPDPKVEIVPLTQLPPEEAAHPLRGVDLHLLEGATNRKENS